MMLSYIKQAFILSVWTMIVSSSISATQVSSPLDESSTESGVKTTDGVVYRDKHVRFTVVSDGMIRLEYDPNGKFIDDKTFVAVNRIYPETKVETMVDDKTVKIKTKKMVLSYIKSNHPFSEKNLSISSAPGVKSFKWTPGMSQKYNLLGTTHTLDGWDGQDIIIREDDNSTKIEQGSLDEGLLARDGWTLIDDSDNLLFDNDKEFEWVKERKKKKGATDWYFLAYGNDYKNAISDFTLLSGKIPLPPRYAFGYWWSRWWAYSEHEINELLDNFSQYNIPIDVLVIDMDWHYTDAEHGGWTGWTWNRRLFPHPEKFLNSLRDRNLKVTLNLHPADGVKRFEATYPEIAKENGIDPSTGKDVPWISSDKQFIKSIFKHILDPMKKDGVSFWWLDWQQEPNDPVIKNLNNTFWLNYTFFTKMKQENNGRPLIYHRWGGLGNHRYQIGFSGDNYVTWKSLDFLPYFTATAANVCYGFWSHDLGGHYLDGDTIPDPELYIRWLQFGAYSPIMRTHSNKNAKLVKEPWRFDINTMNALRKSIQRRYEMHPYIYSMARKSHDTGISICRPMYFDYPDTDASYKLKNQYMFGDNMIVYPITKPGNNGFASIDIWLPEGEWYENATGTMLKGNSTYTRKFALDEIPVYIKAGSIIPYYAEEVKTLKDNDVPIALTIYPGQNGDFTIYEDYGDDDNYDSEFATTDVSSIKIGNKLTVVINPRKGKYKDMPDSRLFEVRTPATLRPDAVRIDGIEASYEYIPEQLCAVVKLPLESCDKKRIIEIEFPDNSEITDGIIGSMKRFVNTFGNLKNLSAGLCVDQDFGPMSTIYEALKWYPNNNQELLSAFRKNFSDIRNVIERQPMNDKARSWFLQSIGVDNSQ